MIRIRLTTTVWRLQLVRDTPSMGRQDEESDDPCWLGSGWQGICEFSSDGVYGNPNLLEDSSEDLRAHMQGKSCFNFKIVDEPLFDELERLTIRSLAGMKKAGYVSDK